MTTQDNDELSALIDSAQLKGQWLWSRYADLWFSPDELRTAHKEGRFRWGAVNWELRDPKEKLAELDERLQHNQKARDEFAAKLK